MNRAIAFLRAINVGGHTVKMETLRGLFERLGFLNVATFIASGNVVFDTPHAIEQSLSDQIEAHLEHSLGYEVITFLRTPEQVAQIAGLQPFDAEKMRNAAALNVGFLKSPLGVPELAALKKLESAIDEFAAVGREVYWLCAIKQSESKFSNVVFERTLKIRTTLRGINTIRRLSELYPPD